MSTKIGTLQAPRAGGSILLAAFLTSLVMLTVAVVAISIDRDNARQGETTFVGRHVVNTPSELSGTKAGSSSIAIGVTPDMQAAIVASRNAADAPSSELSGGSTGNTPSELTGGFDRYALHQRI